MAVRGRLSFYPNDNAAMSVPDSILQQVHQHLEDLLRRQCDIDRIAGNLKSNLVL
ncbi:hypothetical protein D3C86_2097550 [compost metagenome]